MTFHASRARLAAVGCLALLAVESGHAQTRNTATAGTGTPANADWPMYRHDLAGTGFSPLTQITRENVATLKQAWTYALAADAATAAPASGGGGGAAPAAATGATPANAAPQANAANAVNSQVTPVVVNGVMYLAAANRIVALDAVTGKEQWQYRVTGGAPSRRGVAMWAGDATHPPRILFTSGRRLLALDARNGTPVADFGANGEVDLVVPYNSVPLVARNTVIVGANTPQGAVGGIGNPRAYDVRTGAKRWEFSAVAQPGEPGHDTWEGDSWKNRLGANAWPFYFTLDESRGLLYVPLASPIGGAYGGDRKGANLYGNSVVAVDIESGKYRWHFQTIHHDLWDADPPAPPGLFDITQNGRTVPALALTTKSGYMYILNRENGRPIFGVEERPVPASDVPGEAAFPTQPIPVKPPPIARVAYSAPDLVTAADTSAEHVSACEALIAKNGGVQNSGPFTPWQFRPEGAPAKSTLVFPGGLGGANWGGTANDARAGLVFVATQDIGALGWMEKARAGSPFAYDKASLDRTFDVRMPGGAWPCQRPPWGRLMAIRTATGDVAWQIPLGVTDDLPADKQRTGRPLVAGPIATASGLIFIASTDDNRFRAIESSSGRELWVTKLARRGNADPMTYQGRDGKQYVAIVATDTLVTFALP